jgi:uncharacterized protein YdhG (YjbR/CyaY superfamily)
MKYPVSTIEEYLQAIPEERRIIIEKVIQIVKEYFPNVEESMKYKMPTYGHICAIASQKHHITLFIHHKNLVDKYRKELGKKKAGKCCLRFKKWSEFPEPIVRKIFAEIKG